MARSKETFNKKEQEKKKLQKRKEKQLRKEERKAAGASSFEDMIAYTDEFGNITSTPPDPTKKKKEVKVDDMIIGARNMNTGEEQVDPIRKGRVTFFNDSKGYGFIEDTESKDSIFVHVNALIEDVREGNIVSFETERGPKGLNAVNVKIFVEPKKEEKPKEIKEESSPADASSETDESTPEDASSQTDESAKTED